MLDVLATCVTGMLQAYLRSDRSVTTLHISFYSNAINTLSCEPDKTLGKSLGVFLLQKSSCHASRQSHTARATPALHQQLSETSWPESGGIALPSTIVAHSSQASA